MAEPPKAAGILSPPEAGAKPADKPYRYGFKQNGRFSVDNLLVEGSLQGVVEFNPQLQATFRTIPTESIQATEAIVDDDMRRQRSAKYVLNELTIAQLYYGLVAINGKDIPAGKPKYDPKDESDPRHLFIRKLPGAMFDLLVEGLNEFEDRCKRLLRGEALRNF